MEPRKIGVCLQDDVLARQLAGYWGRKAPQYRFLVFAETEAVRKELEEGPLYLLITDGECLDRLKEGEHWGRKRSRIGRIVFIVEDAGEVSAEKEIPCVSRYQSADQILAEAIGMRDAQVKMGPGPAIAGMIEGERADESGTEVIGVYSPIGRCGKSRFALALGKVLSERTRVLYMSLEVFSDLYEWLTASGVGDFSDLLYYHEQGKLTEDAWERLTYALQGMEMVGPAVNPEDVMGLAASRLEAVLRGAVEAGYRVLVLDIGCNHPDPAGLLALCTKVYAPVTDEESSRLKWQHFLTYLKKTGREHLVDRIETVRLPETGSRYEASGLPECGEALEAFVRRLSCWKN